MKPHDRKPTRHVNQNENLIFEKSSPGKAAWKLPPWMFRGGHGQAAWKIPTQRSGQHARK